MQFHFRRSVQEAQQTVGFVAKQAADFVAWQALLEQKEQQALGQHYRLLLWLRVQAECVRT